MALERVLFGEAWSIEAIVDTGITVIAHFENPAQGIAVNLLSQVLKGERRCLIPTSTLLGAYHIMTEYLGVEKVSAYKALTRTLETRSPALYQDISIDQAIDALTYANGYHIESWDGYIIALAKEMNAPMIYSLDEKLATKIKEVHVVNPIPEEEYKSYNQWLRQRLSTL